MPPTTTAFLSLGLGRVGLGPGERHHSGWSGDQLRDGLVGVPGEPDPDRVGDAVLGDVGHTGQGVGNQLAVRTAVVGVGTESSRLRCRSHAGCSCGLRAA